MPRPKDTEIQKWCTMPSDKLEPRQISQVLGLIQRRYGNTMMSAVTAHLQQQPGRNANQAIVAITGNPPIWVREQREREQGKPQRPPRSKEEYMQAIGLAPAEPSDTQTPDAGPAVEEAEVVEPDYDGWFDDLPEDLHEQKNIQRENQRFAALLRLHPGKWRLWKTCGKREQATNIAARIRRADITAFRLRGDFDARAVENPEGAHKVYARYIGTKDGE